MSPPPPQALRSDLRFAQTPSGARIAWASSGRTSGRPSLVRVAAWMTHVEHDTVSPIWRPWLERLGRTQRVIRYDERGCGLSSTDGSPISLDTALEELETVIDACGEPRVALLGMSGASTTAVAYAARHPERVTHLILVGGYAAGLLCRNASAQALAYHESMLTMMAHAWGTGVPAIQQFFTTILVPDATPEQAAALTEQQRRSCHGAQAAAVLRGRSSADVRPLLPLVRCPTLVMHAEHDAMVPHALGLELAGGIAGARFQTLATRNHIPLAGDPSFETFCEAITGFIGAGTEPGLSFSPRERALLGAVADGLDNLQIAARLGLAEKTVRNALSLLYRKIGVEGRPQAIVWARDRGHGNAPSG